MSDKPKPKRSALQQYEVMTHAGIVMICAGIADQQLRDAILTKLETMSRNLEKELFDGYGPLSEFAGKTALAYAMGLLDDVNYKRLRVLRQIRNKFAHSSDFIDFGSPEIVELLKKFPPDTPSGLGRVKAFIWQVVQVETHLVNVAGPQILKPSKTDSK